MNIGTCGCGTIASWISDFLDQLNNEHIVRYGAASNDLAQCRAFTEKYGWQKTYADYETLMDDPAIDLVYICVPNPFHYALCMKAIARGKNVVCEKPFAINDTQTQEILRFAQEKQVFVSEALWPSFLPSRRLIDEVLASGEIGEVTGGEMVSLSYVLFLERVKQLEMGGGALLDMGPYLMGRITDHFGLDIESVQGSFQYLDTGVDSRDDFVVTYRDGRKVHGVCTIDTPHEEGQEYGLIQGTRGAVRFDSLSNPQNIEVLDASGAVTRILHAPSMLHGRAVPFTAGYEYEFLAFERALREGHRECIEAPHAQTLAISRVMTELRRQAGVRYPFE